MSYTALEQYQCRILITVSSHALIAVHLTLHGPLLIEAFLFAQNAVMCIAI